MTNTILLADDSVTIQKVIELTFMDEDYEVVAVGNGDEALDRLEQVTPDVVIADVHMPGANGYDVARRSKQLHPQAPVLLLVGTFEPFDDADYQASGADAILKKPFDSQELLQRVSELMVAHADLTMDPGAAAAPPPPPEASSGPAGFAMPADDDRPADAWAAPADEAEDLGTRRLPTFGGDAEPAAAPEAPEAAGAAGWASWSQTEEPGEELASPSAGVSPAEEPWQPLTEPWEAPAETYEPWPGGAEEPTIEEPPADEPGIDEPGSEDPFGEPPLEEPPSDEPPRDAPPAEEPEEVPEPPVALAADEPAEDAVEVRPEDEGVAGAAAAWVPAAHAAEPFPELSRPAPAPEPSVSGVPAAAAPAEAAAADAGPLSTSDVDRVARRVVELLGDRVVREVAWEVVPDLAEVVIKDRLRELESQVD